MGYLLKFIRLMILIDLIVESEETHEFEKMYILYLPNDNLDKKEWLFMPE